MDNFNQVKMYYIILSKYLRLYHTIINDYKTRKHYLGHNETRQQLRIMYTTKLSEYYDSKIKKYFGNEEEFLISSSPPVSGAGIPYEQYYIDIKYYHNNILHLFHAKYTKILKEYKLSKYKKTCLERLETQDQIVFLLNTYYTNLFNDYSKLIAKQLKVSYDE